MDLNLNFIFNNKISGIVVTVGWMLQFLYEQKLKCRNKFSVWGIINSSLIFLK
uniref:Uncharacterized protein n=1 Tax=Meloidogyne enterolobii TaxID=390850 RepID=A0A6V7UYD4_MELEN|nr:unnamed protein product [Meloidogyne enterolobii]